ncbi:Hypothetical protein PHPALM_17269 [Phytophthora palmivora]|uniref:Uncharacterized protein n=1 Tax=Phytophthora palmivora TaxID=4796 RepID=A0A2P4XMM7_9STRA|nr:Hypothetical protein PHPALM_17269 [Phytophthora palmivora]
MERNSDGSDGSSQNLTEIRRILQTAIQVNVDPTGRITSNASDEFSELQELKIGTDRSRLFGGTIGRTFSFGHVSGTPNRHPAKEETSEASKAKESAKALLTPRELLNPPSALELVTDESPPPAQRLLRPRK